MLQSTRAPSFQTFLCLKHGTTSKTASTLVGNGFWDSNTEKLAGIGKNRYLCSSFQPKLADRWNTFRSVSLPKNTVLVSVHIKQLHLILKTNTSDSRKSWFAVGDYKRLANAVGEEETAQPEEVHRQMKSLLADYNSQKQVEFDDLLDFHVRFERIHPFQDGNGRVGRLLLFWQCLQTGIVPFIITEDLRLFYYRGIQNWGKINGYLRDTCLTAQDSFKILLEYYRIKY